MSSFQGNRVVSLDGCPKGWSSVKLGNFDRDNTNQDVEIRSLLQLARSPVSHLQGLASCPSPAARAPHAPPARRAFPWPWVEPVLPPGGPFSDNQWQLFNSSWPPASALVAAVTARTSDAHASRL